jgi:hypothetical protein
MNSAILAISALKFVGDPAGSPVQVCERRHVLFCAQQGEGVLQFRDLQTHKYVAVSVDEEVHEYGREI